MNGKQLLLNKSRLGTRPSNKRKTQWRCVTCASNTRKEDVIVAPGDMILVAGATGGVGQLLTKFLLDRGFRVKALSRSRKRGEEILGQNSRLEIIEGDILNKESLSLSMDGVSAVCCVTGTTAFPTLRWLGNNDPEQNGYVGTKNLLDLAKEQNQRLANSIHRFVFVSSAGVERYAAPPYSVMNAFGVLTFKKKAEEEIEASGLPYTIIRPCRLTDAPYTSYDLNTLIKGKSGARKEVAISVDECLDGETSRISTAESCLQSLLLPCTSFKTFSIESVSGAGPGTDTEMWAKRLEVLI